MSEAKFIPSEEILYQPVNQALPEHAVAISHEEAPGLDEQIENYEKELGFENSMDRLGEAALFIDQKLLKAEVIFGRNPHPERLFGDDAWADWLNARLVAKRYGRRPLTPEFIAQLQAATAKNSAPLKAGFLRKDVVLGGSYTNIGSSLFISPEQLAAIQANPRLDFLYFETDEDGRIEGMIEYPSNGLHGPSARPLILAELKQICDWYNQERLKPEFDPYQLAASLQHQLISVHAFEDNNGRLSRLLMNWSLENDGCEPSILYDPSDDLFNTEEDWARPVRFGSEYVGKLLKDRKEALASIGEDDPAFMLGVDGYKTFYSYVYEKLPASYVPEEKSGTDHQNYERFWEKFKEEYELFKAKTTREETLKGEQVYSESYQKDSPQTILQGGLISDSYINLVKHGKVMPETIRESFFGDLKLYRGGVCSKLLTDEEICRMFTGFVGIGTGYTALDESYTSPTSPNTVQPAFVVEAMARYNQTLANDYLLLEQMGQNSNSETSQGPDSRQYQSELAKLISIHTGFSNHRGSPFVSTSINGKGSKIWAVNFSEMLPQDANGQRRHAHGFIFQSRAPLSGAIKTFSAYRNIIDNDHKPELPVIAQQEGFTFIHPNEEELLIPGGLDPNSIEAVYLFDSEQATNFYPTPSMVVTRAAVDGLLEISIDDYLNATRKIYRLNPDQKTFSLHQEMVLEAPAEEEIEAEAQPIPDANSYDSEDIFEPPYLGLDGEEIFPQDVDSLIFNQVDESEAANNLIMKLQAGELSGDEAMELISQGSGFAVADQLEHIQNPEYMAIAQSLIDSGLAIYVADNIHLYPEQYHHQIAEVLLSHGLAGVIAGQLKNFKNIDHTLIAQSLLDGQEMFTLITCLHNFKNLSDNIAQQLIEEGFALSVVNNRSSFEQLSSETTHALEEKGYAIPDASKKNGLG